MRTAQTKPSVLTSKWQQSPAQWISVCTGNLFFTISISVKQILGDGCLWHLTCYHQLVSYGKREQIPTSEILGLFQQFPWSHRGASSMHRSCSVTLRSFEEVGKDAGNSRTELKDTHFSAGKWRECAKSRIIMVNLIVYDNFFTLICNILSSAKKLNPHFSFVF